MRKPIETFIVNLEKRKDRKAYIIKEFAGKQEFSINIVLAHTSKYGALGLWRTMRSIVKTALEGGSEYILICEDDHKFTGKYSKKYLYRAIDDAQKKEADLLLGGVSWFSSSVKVSKELFWLESFSGTQFFIVFRKFFEFFLADDSDNETPADARMGFLTKNIMVMYPFVSIQEEFGYSDATQRNNEIGRVKKLFKYAQANVKIIEQVRQFYEKLNLNPCSDRQQSFENVTIPTYIINLPERKERLAHVKKQFEGKPEFQVNIIEACHHKIGAFGLWLSIRKVIEIAISNDDDVIIICEDDHQFTDSYSKEYLLKNIIDAHHEGANILSGGTGKFGYAIPITKNRYWVNHCLSAQFLVVYRQFFNQILSEPFNKKVIADMTYSAMTSAKMVLYPFISTQKDFGYSDVTPLHNEDKNVVNRLFGESVCRLKDIQDAHIRYSIHKEDVT